MAKKEINQGVADAIKKFGSTYALADAMKVTQPMVCHWLYRRITAERALQLEAVTGISRSKIRPDLFDTKHGID